METADMSEIPTVLRELVQGSLRCRRRQDRFPLPRFEFQPSHFHDHRKNHRPAAGFPLEELLRRVAQLTRKVLTIF